jgi:hypothetical protein
MKRALFLCFLVLGWGLGWQMGEVGVAFEVEAQASLNATEALKLPGTGESVKSTFPNFATVVMVVVRALIVGTGILFMGVILISGYKLVFKADKDKELAEAKKNLTNALGGILLVALAYWITVIVGMATGNSDILM